MRYTSNLSPLLLMCVVVLTGPVFAQQSPDSAKSPPSATSKIEAAASQSATPSALQPAATDAAAGSATPAEPPAPQINAVFIPAHDGTEPPSADFIKKAKEQHWHAKLKQGIYLFCKTDTDIGTRLASEKCITESELKSVMARADEQRQAFQQRGGCSGACGSQK